MKRLFLLSITGLFFAGCSNQGSAPASETKPADSAKTEAKAETPAAAPVTYAYPIGYSSDFSFGDSKNAQKVLELWKDWDDNSFDKHADYFADTVTLDLRDGTHIRGSRDSVMKITKAMRATITSSISSIDVVTSLKPNGKDESWVNVWGKEVDVLKKGKKDSTLLQENWMFDKGGKIAYMLQYSRKFSK